MPNAFYNVTGTPTPRSPGSSAAMRAELALIAAGFDKLPTLSGNAGKFAKVNAAASALDVSALLSESGGAITVDGALSITGNVTLGNASTDTLTIHPSAVTWSNNPTHSGNHTFSGNLTVAGETRLNGNTYIGNQSTDTLTIEPLSVSLPNGSLTISGPVGLALNGATTDPYGGFSVTRPNNANAYSYFSMTRAGQAAFGIGINTSNEVWLGPPTPGANGVLSGTPWLRLNGTQGYINGQLVWHAGNDGAGSGLDADTLDGLNPSSAADPSSIALRTSDGYLYAVHFNQSSSNNENPTIGQVMVTTGTDNFLRKANLAHLTNQLQGGLTLAASQVTSGTFADARIAQSNVTQHQTALAIACSQITAGTFADARVALSNVTQFYTSGHAANGYQTLPTGLILQWGTTSSIGAGSSASVSFPIAFPAACYTVVSTPNGVGGSAQAESYVTSIGSSSFTQVNSGTTSKAFKWFAIGK